MRAAVGSASLALAVLAGAAAPELAGAPVPRIGLLAATHCEGHRRFAEFREGLRELGDLLALSIENSGGDHKEGVRSIPRGHRKRGA